MIVLAFLVFAARYAVRPAFVTPEEDRSVVAAADAARQFVKPGEPTATLHGTTLDLLYYCDRPGWAISANDARLMASLARCRAEGARYLVVAGWKNLPREAQEALARLSAVERMNDYGVFQLEMGILKSDIGH